MHMMTQSMTTEPVLPECQDSINLALLTWIGTMFLWFFPGLLVYLIKMDNKYVADQAKESINWAFTGVIGCFVASLLSFISVDVFLYPAIFAVHVIFCIMGAIATAKGKSFRVPFAIRMLK